MTERPHDGSRALASRVLYPVMATLTTLGLHHLARLPWGWAALAGFVGWPLAGTLLTADDELPGGFANLDGKQRPDWATPRFWGHICTGGAVAAAVGALDAGWPSRNAAILAALAIAAAVAAALLRKRDSSPR